MFVFACAFVQTKQHGLGRTCRTVGPHSLLHSFASFYILHTSRLFVQAFPVEFRWVGQQNVDGGGFQIVKAGDGYLYGQFESLKYLARIEVDALNHASC